MWTSKRSCSVATCWPDLRHLLCVERWSKTLPEPSLRRRRKSNEWDHSRNIQQCFIASTQVTGQVTLSSSWHPFHLSGGVEFVEARFLPFTSIPDFWSLWVHLANWQLSLLLSPLHFRSRCQIETHKMAEELLYVQFNQDFTSLGVGTNNGWALVSVSSLDNLERIHEQAATDGVQIVERLFSSSLVAIVSLQSPRKLRVCHFRKNNEICNYSYANTILGVRLNRAVSLINLKKSLWSVCDISKQPKNVIVPAFLHVFLLINFRDWLFAWRKCFIFITSVIWKYCTLSVTHLKIQRACWRCL